MVRKFLTALVLTATLASNAMALPATVRYDETSPLFPHKQTIADIYIKSCAAGLDDSFYHSTFPMYTVDKLVDKFKTTNPKGFPLHNQTILIVGAGFDIGRAIAQTDTDFNEKETLCQIYGINFTASTVNHAERQTGGGAILPPPPPPGPISSLEINGKANAIDALQATKPMPDSPLYDLIINAKNAQVKRLKVTPRLAEMNGCRYMWSVLAKQPVIEVSAMDATLDIMENMLWDGYSNDDIKFGFNYFLQGAKFGRFIFATKQPITMCYD
jgi:hypothetical protein